MPSGTSYTFGAGILATTTTKAREQGDGTSENAVQAKFAERFFKALG
jgi:hypothetical protein